jgi:Spy/CpxP family protein refolding chaperone
VTRQLFCRVGTGLAVVVLAGGLCAGVAAQGRRGGGGGGTPLPAVDLRSRLQILTDAFGLERDARNAVRATLDAAHTEAAPLRASLVKTRAALAEAVAAGGPPETIAEAARAYGAAATAMTAHEMKALVKVREHLTPEQRKQGTAVAFYLMRGMFLDDRRWDVRPERRNY